MAPMSEKEIKRRGLVKRKSKRENYVPCPNRRPQYKKAADLFRAYYNHLKIEKVQDGESPDGVRMVRRIDLDVLKDGEYHEAILACAMEDQTLCAYLISKFLLQKRQFGLLKKYLGLEESEEI